MTDRESVYADARADQAADRAELEPIAAVVRGARDLAERLRAALDLPEGTSEDSLIACAEARSELNADFVQRAEAAQALLSERQSDAEADGRAEEVGWLGRLYGVLSGAPVEGATDERPWNTCPWCDATVDVDDAHEGTVVRCSCGMALEVASDLPGERPWALIAAELGIDDAVDLAVRYGGIDGDHHKAWVIDQMVRVLLGPASYRDLRSEIEAEDETWSEGIAP